jgi:hypothetical protein
MLSGDNQTTTKVNGRKLAYDLRSLPPHARGIRAARINGGPLIMDRPTDKQICGLFGVSRPTLKRARGGGKSAPQDAAAKLDRIVRRHGIENVWAALSRALG